MKINCSNKNELNNLQVHDSIFEGYYYNYGKQTIQFSCKNFFLGQEIFFTFNKVIFCSMQSCSFWHGGNSILGISIEEKCTQLERLMKIQDSNPDLYAGSKLDKDITYLVIEITLNSGDELLIICESIDFLAKEFDVSENSFVIPN